MTEEEMVYDRPANAPSVGMHYGLLRELTDIGTTLQDEIKLRFMPDGVHTSFVDPAHVAMCEMYIPKDAFIEFDVSAEFEMGLDIEKLKTILRHVRSEKPDLRYQVVHHKRTDDRCYQSLLSMMDLYEDTDKFDILLPWISTEGMCFPKIPGLNLPTRLVVSPTNICRVLKNFEEVSDHVLLMFKAGTFTISVSGDGWHERSYKTRPPVLDGMDQHSRALFPMDYFANMIRNITSMKTMTINIGNDLPIKIAGRTEGGIEVGYYLAPRIEND